MLADFVKAIQGLAEAARAPRVLEVPGVPRKRWIEHGGELEGLELPAPDREHKLHGYDDVVAAARDSVIAPGPELYFDAAGVVLVLDRHDRRARVTMPLVESERFKLLRALRAQAHSLAQKAAVKLLRYDLHGTGVETVLQALRVLDFSRTSDGTRTVEHGKESLGRTVEARVQRADKVPESFKVTTPVWSNAGLRGIEAAVEVGLFLDMDDEKVELRVLADEIDRALVVAQTALREKLAKDLPDVPTFNGAP